MGRHAGLAISWIDGLEQSEAPQFIDTVGAGLGAVVAAAATWALLTHRTRAPAHVGMPAIAVGALTVVAMLQGATHVHSHDDADDATHGHPTPVVAAGGQHDHADDDTAGTGHPHSDHSTDTTQPGTDAARRDADSEGSAAAWPRPWDPTAPIDFSGVPGVTAEQEARAEALVAHTLEVLPQFTDPSTLEVLGYHSVGDAATGFEHYINLAYAFDDAFLDPAKPESLVYRVDGDRRTLASAMYTADQMAIDDPELIGYGGLLMQWHVHNNLCWASKDDGAPYVVALTDDHGGTCPSGTVHAGGDIPMVHVWITRHDCGPFAALEGDGAGQADAAPGERVDQCGDAPVTHHHEPAPAAPTAPSDPQRDDVAAPNPRRHTAHPVERRFCVCGAVD